jgi:flagellar hook-basal body complex protein FliE
MVNFNPNIGQVQPKMNFPASAADNAGGKTEFSDTMKAVGKYISDVDDQQRTSDTSIVDMLSGKGDIVSVVSEVAKADMSFKLLVGVRNKLIEAYKQTMNMQL